MCLEAPCSSSHILVKVWTTSSLSQRLIQPARLCLAGRAVNQALVVRNWLIGAHLLEFEQSGQDRATYGERLLSNLAGDLKARGLKGLGISMLKNCRQFYRLYPGIRQSLAGELGTIPVRPEIRQSALANSIQVRHQSVRSICYGSPGRISSN